MQPRQELEVSGAVGGGARGRARPRRTSGKYMLCPKIAKKNVSIILTALNTRYDPMYGTASTTRYSEVVPSALVVARTE